MKSVRNVIKLLLCLSLVFGLAIMVSAMEADAGHQQINISDIDSLDCGGINITGLEANSLPVITSQPVDYTGAIGENATFTVAAEGEEISYQWQVKTSETAAWRNTTIYGYRTPTISVPITAARHNYQYRCILTQRDGTKTTEAARLSVLPAMSIVSQPEDYAGIIGNNATFTVVAEGEGIRYQWQVKTSETAAWKNTTIYGYRTPTISVPITAARHNYQYRCVLTQRDGTKTTEAVRLSVLPTMSIVSQPEDYTGIIGNNATFTVVAEGEGICYQWQVKTSETAAWKNTTISGAKTPTVTVPISKERNGFQYRCQITGQYGEVLTSDIAQLRIVEPTYCKPMLTIIDDDGDIHFLTDIIPLIQELQVPISTAVTTKRIGSSARWMDWDEIAECAENGAEVLCHTYSHYTGTQIQSVADETIIKQYKMARDALNAKGYNGDILVYSSSTGNDARVQAAAAQVFKCGIKIGGNTTNYMETNPFALNRCRIDYAETEGKTSWNIYDMKQYIDDVAASGGWQIMMFHTSNSMWRQRVLLDDEGNVIYDSQGEVIPMTDNEGNPVMDINGQYPTVGSVCYIPLLREVILYAQECGVEIVTAEKGYNTIYH